jgi:hypothetical protein
MNPIRTYDAATLVTLPKVNGNGLAALLKAVLAVKNVPASLKKPQAKVTKALKNLKTAQARVVAASSGEERAADDAEDTIFRAVYQWLHGWSLLGGAEGRVAVGLLECMYPDDSLRFIQLPYREEWAEADTRIARLAKQQLEPGFKKLGGQLFLTRLHAVHKAYGTALHITREQDDEVSDGAISVADAMAGAEAALREYVLKASALAESDKPASLKLVARLLKPVTDAESSGRGGGSHADPGPSPAPEPTKPA